MANSNRRKRRKNQRLNQTVYSEKRKVFIGRYLSPKGQRLVDEGKLTKEEADVKYGKNRYRINPAAVPVKQIKHIKPYW